MDLKALLSASGLANRTVRFCSNQEFMQPAMEEGSAFVAWIGGDLDDILCERFERTVGYDNCAHFEGMVPRIPVTRRPPLILRLLVVH